jgi:hypothetical protein
MCGCCRFVDWFKAGDWSVLLKSVIFKKGLLGGLS